MAILPIKPHLDEGIWQGYAWPHMLVKLRQLLTPGVILAQLLLCALLFLFSSLWLFWFNPSRGLRSEPPEVALTIIPGPSSTPPKPTASAIPSSTPTATSVPLRPGEVGLGSYVQIVGTDGDGLNIRNAPGLSSDVQFLGYDAEVFEVREGPMEVDGFIWWYLVTPVDEARAGWAAASFLSVVANP